jgi:pantoate--beta-alanine ligase
MGGLHDGHLALVRRAGEECARTVVTIFVNPTQFNNPADLKVYPRDEAADLAMLSPLGVDLVFAPVVEEMYPPDFDTKVTVGRLTDCLCGIARPGHMDGVATVVTKLLLQSLPDVAYFGEKDYQQLLVVRSLARDLDIPVRIAAVPTVREPDGLAMSSRNGGLTREQRGVAPALYRVLATVAERVRGGARPAAPDLAWGRAELARAGFDSIDYLELRTSESLDALDMTDRPARVFGAAWLGSIRLIDNVPVD